MSNLHLMSMRCDVVRDSVEGVKDPFNQAERSAADTPAETSVACEVWNGSEDVVVNERRVAALSVWQGIMDLRSGVRPGDRLTNLRARNGAALFGVDEYAPQDGGDQALTLRVLRAAAVAGHHIGLTCESLRGVTDG